MNTKRQTREIKALSGRVRKVIGCTASGNPVRGKIRQRGSIGIFSNGATVEIQRRERDKSYSSTVLAYPLQAAVPKHAPISKRIAQTVIEAARNLDAGRVSAPVDFERFRKFTK